VLGNYFYDLGINNNIKYKTIGQEVNSRRKAFNIIPIIGLYIFGSFLIIAMTPNVIPIILIIGVMQFNAIATY
jgi:hypothetical protein